jgi:hypothetical protein
MDVYSAIIVLAPLVAPLGQTYGVHPARLGITFLPLGPPVLLLSYVPWPSIGIPSLVR